MMDQVSPIPIYTEPAYRRQLNFKCVCCKFHIISCIQALLYVNEKDTRTAKQIKFSNWQNLKSFL